MISSIKAVEDSALVAADPTPQTIAAASLGDTTVKNAMRFITVSNIVFAQSTASRNTAPATSRGFSSFAICSRVNWRAFVSAFD